jgi:hypothetical protein
MLTYSVADGSQAIARFGRQAGGRALEATP